MKYKKTLITSLTFCIMSILNFSADQIPEAENVDALSSLNKEAIEYTVTSDNISDQTDVDMFAVQHPEDIILKTNDKTTVIFSDEWDLKNEGTTNEYYHIDETNFSEGMSVLYTDVAFYYDTDIKGVTPLDMRLTINSYVNLNDGLIPSYFNVFTNFDKGIHIQNQNCDVDITLEFLKDDGSTITDRNVEFLWTDFDVLSSISFTESQLSELIVPTSDGIATTDKSDPNLYYSLTNLVESELFEDIKYTTYPSGVNTMDYADERINYYRNNNRLTLFDTWGNRISLPTETIEDIGEEVFTSYKGIEIEGDNIQNTPGQNLLSILSTGKTGSIDLSISSQLKWTGKSSMTGNNLYIQSPDMANTLIDKSITDSNNNGIAENGETLTYSLDIQNQSPTTTAYMIHIKDSLIDNVPKGLKFNNDVSIDNGEIVGDSSTGDFYIKEIIPGGNVKVSYSFDVININEFIATGNTSIDNIATDNGAEPLVCDEVGNGIDCGEAVISPNGYTDISKSTIDENEDGILQVGENLTYDIHLENNSGYDAYDVLVRDSIFEEELPSYLELSDIIITTSGFDVETTGDLANGDLKLDMVPSGESVDIVYSLKLLAQPEDEIVSITNIVTDTGETPETCDNESNGIDCGETITSIEPKPIINKLVSDENSDGIVQNDEVLTYEINVINESKLPTTNNIIRDSLLENLPEYVDFNNNPTIEGSKFDVETSGDFIEGNFTINEIPGKSSVKIIYDLKVNDIPDNVDSLLNIVTDNGTDPEICEAENKGIDCDEAIIPTEPNTLIGKTVVDENEDGIVQDNEIITYKINVSNESNVMAKNIIVRDSMLENLPEFVSIADDPTIKGSKFDVESTGNLANGDFTILEIPAKSNAVITYKLKVDEVPKDIEYLLNIVTDNGEDPLICKEEDKTIDCDEAIIPTHAETLITKSITDENEDGLVQEGEILNYTITVTNPTRNKVNDVNVRDSLLEDLPEYLIYNEDLKINPTETKSTGDLSKGDFTLETIEANSVIEISYSLTANEVPKKINEVVNIVTDNGDDPEVCKEESQGIDCDTATIPKEKIRLITVKEEEEDTPSMPHTGM